LNCFGFAGGFTVGAGQGLFASAVADTEGVALAAGVAVSVPLSSSFSSRNPPPITKTVSSALPTMMAVWRAR